MYSLAQLYRGIRDPRRSIIELNRLYHEYLLGVERIGVMDADWDTLIILDGCRFDLFNDVIDFQGSLSRVVSRGSSTPEFLQENFGEQQYLNTVYVSANPQLAMLHLEDHFLSCIRVWEDGWDSDLQTVPPEVVTDWAIAANRQYPDKRLIVHFVQPHVPFIGPKGRSIQHAGFAENQGEPERTENPTIWDRLEHGSITVEEAWDAYRENLELALPEVERLIESVPGKSVITSDHGNAFGEWGVYGHPGKHYLEGLVAVPWFETVRGERRKTSVGERVRDGQSASESTIENRLSDLGYTT